MAKASLTVQIDAEIRQKLDDAAQQFGTSISDVVSQIISIWLVPMTLVREATETATRLAQRQVGLDDRITVIADFIADHTRLDEL